MPSRARPGAPVAPSVTLLAALALLLGACTSAGTDPGPEDGPEPVAEEVAGDLSTGTFAGLPVTTGSAEPQALWDRVSEDMAGSSLSAEVREVTLEGEGAATAGLRLTWSLPETSQTWDLDTEVALARDQSGQWQAVFDESVLGLRPGEVLALSSVEPARGAITGADGVEIVRLGPVLRFGIDKTAVKRPAWRRSVRALARVVDVDAGALLARVRAAGEEAFVEAIVLRRSEATAAAATVSSIRGAVALPDRLALAPTRDFARPILGSVGAVTAEMIEESDGALQIGDQVGLSGLQERYEDRLRGTAGWLVSAEPADDASGRARRLFRVRPGTADPLATTLDVEAQALAERVLAQVGPASALVAVRPSTGEVLAAASGPGGGGLSTATVGRYAPGSTFKVITSLALLRHGLSPDSPMTCPASVVVDGKTFTNYDDYPANALGPLTLREAVANSCNTAFIGQRGRARDLAGAAEALGLGRDYDVGFPAYFGQVPSASTDTGRAAATIGQGEVLASPLAMAGVAASVAGGGTVVPHLLTEMAPEPAAADPLTAAEARQLRVLMRAVVTQGSGAALAGLPGPPVLAKTGTAEFGEKPPLPTHAWMLGAQGDLAVAVFVERGDSGSGTAGPLLERFLREAPGLLG